MANLPVRTGQGNSIRYYFSDEDGETFLPVANGSFDMDNMSGDYSTGSCFVAFYDAQRALVRPTGGTVSFLAGAIDGQYLTPPSNATIQATDVEVGTASYTPPEFTSIVTHSRMTLAGITGATFVRAFHWRSQSS